MKDYLRTQKNILKMKVAKKKNEHIFKAKLEIAECRETQKIILKFT